MSEQMPPLLPCPFCGTNARWMISTDPPEPVYNQFVECFGCGASTAYCQSKDEALNAWNTRSSPTPAAIEEDEASAIYDKLAEREPQIKGDIVSRIVDAVYRSVEITEAGTWWLNNLRAKARVKHIITKHLNARGEEVLLYRESGSAKGGCPDPDDPRVQAAIKEGN